MHHITIEGVQAIVRYGYQKAADLGAWKLDGGWLVAEVRNADMYRLAQSPLVLEIPNGTEPPLRRQLLDVRVTQGQLSGRVVKEGAA